MWKSHTPCGTGLKRCVLLIVIAWSSVGYELDGIIALALIVGQFLPRQLAQQMRLHQRPAEARQSFEIVRRFGNGTRGKSMRRNSA